jgi:hypothetical protein
MDVNDISAFTIKLYGIFKVLRSACYVTEHVIYTRVMTEIKCVYCEVRTESLYVIQVNRRVLKC